MINENTLIKTPVSTLTGISSRGINALKRLNIQTVWDLLLHLPTGYQDRGTPKAINSLREGEIVTVKGLVESTHISGMGRKSIYNINLNDGTGIIRIAIFNFKTYQVRDINIGEELSLYGKISFYNGKPQMTNPEFSDENSDENANNTFTPTYGLTSGIKMQAMRKYVNLALDFITDENCPELLPKELRTPNTELKLSEAFKQIHHPNKTESLNDLFDFRSSGYRRIIMEELTAHQLSLIKLRELNQERNGLPLKGNQELIKKFLSTLKFKPTSAQTRVFKEICSDMNSDIPMNRLVQGDVGSGKTLVAALAALYAVSSGVQAALMAPTEILAEQHASKLEKLFTPLGIKTASLLGKHTASQKKEVIKKLKAGEIDIVIGTHAIFQKNVEYKNLKLIIIDEQHRFGVGQRLMLRSKAQNDGKNPHMLALTATPIPRTLAQTMYADMKVSVIDELPPGRTPIKTFLLTEQSKNKLLPKIKDSVAKHLQIYWVCCLVNESDTVEGCQDTESAAEYLKESIPGINVGIVHGQMKAQEKEDAMNKFKNRETDILVATSVIEVGVDVPNAFLIVIENAERYGLAQLHQLRGRVGRGSIESYCCLLCSSNISPIGLERMQVLKESTDGFYIAEKDLELRGPGDLMGTKQTGEMTFKVAELIRDTSLTQEATETAAKIHNNWPDNEKFLLDCWYPEGENVSKA